MDPSDEAVRRHTKELMRQRFRSRRASFPAAAAATRSAALRERLLELLEGAERVALFWPMVKQREVDLRPVDAILRGRGVRVAYPRCEMEPRHMEFHFVDDPDAMVTARMGYREPAADTPIAEVLDVVVVPGLAFDPRGYRIGYGAGFYDGALPRHCPPGASIGVAFDFQLAAEIPNTRDDVPVERIVTDQRVLDRES